MKRIKPEDDASDDYQWPRFSYEVKNDYIGLVGPNGTTWKPIPPEGSHRRKYEIYGAAKDCLLLNLQGPLVSPREYRKLFDALNLHHLHIEFMTMRGTVRGICVVCDKELSGNQKRYCSDPCRSTEKQRRARDKHPERKLRR